MAEGIHWEWRGFGAVSAAFAARFTALDPLETGLTVRDRYFWAPGLHVNLKTRSGAEGDLKIKRPLATNEIPELWQEDPDDLFYFPLTPEAWAKLAGVLESAGLPLGPFPSTPPSLEMTTSRLVAAGCTAVEVIKHRAIHAWRGRNGRVLVEWARLEAPQRLLSIGLEADVVDDAPGDGGARADLRAALEALALDQEALRVMNYLEVVGKWARGEMI